MTSFSVVVPTARQPIVLMHLRAHSILDDVNVVDVNDVRRWFSYIMNSPMFVKGHAWTEEKQFALFHTVAFLLF